MKNRLASLAAAFAAFASAGCSFGPDLAARVDQLTLEKQTLERINTDLEGRLAAAEARNASLERERANRRGAERPEPALNDELSRQGVRLRRRGNDTVIDIPADVTFPSGSSVLTKEGERVLREVVSLVRERHAGSMIRVEGHADSDPIRRTKGKYHCNWELSFERAHAVAHYLMEKGGFDPRRMAVDCYGDGQPQDPKNKARNRRVEIVVEP